MDLRSKITGLVSAYIVFAICIGCFSQTAYGSFDAPIWPFERSWNEIEDAEDDLLHEVGWPCPGACRSRLERHHWHPDTTEFCDRVLIATISEFVHRFKAVDYQFSAHFLDQLPREIVRVSHAFGVDPLMMTGKIHRETNFRADPPNSSGARGLTQLTGLGILELAHQMGFGGRSNFTPGVELIKGPMYAEYLNEQELAIWMDWLRFSAQNGNHRRVENRDLVRGEQGLRFALAGGAALLKFQVARLNGDYNRALQSFNGETDLVNGVPRMVIYARNIIRDFNQLVQMAKEKSGTYRDRDGLRCMPEEGVPDAIACLSEEEWKVKRVIAGELNHENT